MRISSSHFKEINSLIINREIAHRGTILWSHVSNCGSICKCEWFATFSKKFYKLPNDTSLSQHLGNGENNVGRSSLWVDWSDELESNYFRKNHRYCLSKHYWLCFDATNSPANYSKAINHGSMGVCTNNWIWIENTFSLEYNSGKIFKIHLMNYTWPWRYNEEIVECTLTPFQKWKSLLISSEF